jgi:alpha-D-ribose 1-methylphosphonate 5-triphosphate synthase subunit PhnL
MLHVHSLSKHFTLHLRGGLQLPVLDKVSLSVEPGECVALLGPSGRGKSTLMKCLYGSYGAEAGTIWFDASEGRIDIAQATPQQMLALRRRDIAYVSQFLRAVPRVPAVDVVAERWLQARPEVDADEAQEEARRHARALLHRLNLPESLWILPPATFSGGEQQRVNIARGFIEPARLLLLDEPTASLDAANRRVVIELIHEARAAGSAIVGIFHDEEVRDAVASRCVTIGTDSSVRAEPVEAPAQPGAALRQAQGERFNIGNGSPLKATP